MNSFFSTSQLTISGPSDPCSGTRPGDGQHAQSQRGLPTSQNDEPSTDPFSLIPSIPITPTLLLNAHAALNPYLIKCEPLLGDTTVWELFLKPHSASYGIGHSLFDYSPFHAISPRDLKDSKEEFSTCTWVIEHLRGSLFPQSICVKAGALVCLQDTIHAFGLTDPRLPTIWGIVGGLAQAKPGYQIHYLIIIAQSLTYPPTHEPEKGLLISIPTFYLDQSDFVSPSPHL